MNQRDSVLHIGNEESNIIEEIKVINEGPTSSTSTFHGVQQIHMDSRNVRQFMIIFT